MQNKMHFALFLTLLLLCGKVADAADEVLTSQVLPKDSMIVAEGNSDVSTYHEAAASSSAPSFSIADLQRREVERSWEERRERSTVFLADLETNDETVTALRAEMKKIQTKRNQNRALCVDSIRRASKFTKVDTVVRCYRDELNWTLARVEKERELIAVLPGLGDDVRSLALTRADLFADALGVMTVAMDSEVYESVEDLQEAKVNLYQNYMKPYHLMLVRVKAETLRTWIATLLMRVADVLEQEALETKSNEKLLTVIDCLTPLESDAKLILSSQDADEATDQYSMLQEKVRTCSAGIRSDLFLEDVIANSRSEAELLKAQREAEAAIAEKEGQLSRRLRRRVTGTEFRVEDQSSATIRESGTTTHQAAPVVQSSSSSSSLPKSANGSIAVQATDRSRTECIPIGRKLAKRLGVTCLQQK